MCCGSFYHATAIVRHCKDEHETNIGIFNNGVAKITLVVQTKEFPSWVSFNSWREEEEAITHSFFVQSCGETMGFRQDKLEQNYIVTTSMSVYVSEDIIPICSYIHVYCILVFLKIRANSCSHV